MAKKSVEGQLDLFELFSSVEELEESVKGVPELETEPEADAKAEKDAESEAKEAPKQPVESEAKEAPRNIVLSDKQMQQAEGAPVMQRSFRNAETDAVAAIAYLNYNKVYLKDWQREPIIYTFDSSKDAVDFYVAQMERLSDNKKVKVQKEPCALERAAVQKWTGEVEV